jgi:quinol-cytochrome oxidoreductase complex cytochrome b subunit
LLLILSFGFAFTGIVLTWDAPAYAATVAGLAWIAKIPLVGEGLARLVRGGDEVGAATLSRLYSLHALLLPWLAFYLVLLHLWLRSRRAAGVAGSA